MQTWADIAFADGAYTFKLGLAQIAEIERKCDCGIGAIYGRVLKGRYGLGEGEVDPLESAYRLTDLVEVIRQGLIGGGSAMVDGATVKITPARANQLVETYVFGVGDQRMALRSAWALAAAILMALIEGYEPPKEEPGDGPATPPNAST